MIVTVTANAALDRTVLVPNFQAGRRHRATSANTAAGGKGINVARGLRRLGIPVVVTGLAGGRSGLQIIDRLTTEGLLNDLVRIQGESRTSTAVIDPTTNVSTEINEWGPEVEEHELDVLREKLAYLAQSARYIVFCGSLPRAVDPDLYGDLIRDAARKGVETVLDTDAEPLHQGMQAGLTLVTPNQIEAEQLVGHEFTSATDFEAGLDDIAGLGARDVIITRRQGCYALLHDQREPIRLRATTPTLDPVSTIGAGDALLAGYLAARYHDKSAEDAVRQAVATGAASVREAGAGRFDQKEVARLASAVNVDVLAGAGTRS